MNTFFPNLGYLYTVRCPKSRKNIFNWSEVHSQRSDFLQNPYFKIHTGILQTAELREVSWYYNHEMHTYFKARKYFISCYHSLQEFALYMYMLWCNYARPLPTLYVHKWDRLTPLTGSYTLHNCVSGDIHFAFRQIYVFFFHELDILLTYDVASLVCL